MPERDYDRAYRCDYQRWHVVPQLARDCETKHQAGRCPGCPCCGKLY